MKKIIQKWQAARQLGESMSQKAREGVASSLRSDGWEGVGDEGKYHNEGEMIPGSQGDLVENHFTGQHGWKLILGMTKELRRQPSLGHTSEAWL